MIIMVDIGIWYVKLYYNRHLLTRGWGKYGGCDYGLSLRPAITPLPTTRQAYSLPPPLQCYHFFSLFNQCSKFTRTHNCLGATAPSASPPLTKSR